MITNFLNQPISEINYNLKSNFNTHFIQESINLFDIKEKMTILETIDNFVHQIKFVFEKSEQKKVFENLIKIYGNPTHFYDEENFTEKELNGDFTSWNIKTLNQIPYNSNKIEFSNNNIWKTKKHVVNLLKFSTIRGFEGEYTYLNFFAYFNQNLR